MGLRTKGHFTLGARAMTMKFVGALEAHPKAVPWKFEIEFCVVTCSVKTYYATRFSTECYFIAILFIWMQEVTIYPRL